MNPDFSSLVEKASPMLSGFLTNWLIFRALVWGNADTGLLATFLWLD